jgi:ParB/RepB/Spo0J family partition protein
MAKNFNKANSAKMIKDIAKASSEKANVIQVKMIGNDSLFDYPKNHEDCNDTADLENSIKELGFTDPIEVTNFGMEDGQYTIVSGHRRRVAGVNTGMETFPCIIKNFDNEHDMRNYVLLANSQRDTAKDPLLFCKRYKMHEEYLKESGFDGSVREEIAKRLGISPQQADRYKQFNKIILPVWDMVRNEEVGMSSVLPMATHIIEEQEEILVMMNECSEQGKRLTRDMCDKIIKGYRDGARSFIELFEQEPVVKDSGMLLNPFINTEPSETKDGNERNRNDEIRREHDPNNPLNEKDPYADERLTEEDYETIEAVSNADKQESEKEKKPPLTEEEKKMKRGLEIGKHLESLEKCFNDFYVFADEDTAEVAMRTMSGVAKMMFEELRDIADDYNREPVFKEIAGDLFTTLEKYKQA